MPPLTPSAWLCFWTTRRQSAGSLCGSPVLWPRAASRAVGGRQPPRNDLRRAELHLETLILCLINFSKVENFQAALEVGCLFKRFRFKIKERQED